MRGTTISEGSRNDARNLDDLRSRWLMRREALAEVEGVSTPISDAPVKVPSSAESQNALMRANKARLDEIGLEQERLRRTPGNLPKSLINARYVALEAEKTYRRALARDLHAAIQGPRKKDPDHLAEIDRLTAVISAHKEKVKRMGAELEAMRSVFAEANQLSEIETKLIGAVRRANWYDILGILSGIAKGYELGGHEPEAEGDE